MAYRPTEKTMAHKAAVRARLLAAARTLVSHGGFSALTIANVAQQAGIATGGVYKYFESKSHLCTEVFQIASEWELAKMTAAAHGEGSPTQRLLNAIHVFSERALRSRRLAYGLIAEPVDTLVEDARLRLRQAYAAVYESLVEEGMQANEFAPQDARVSAAALVGGICEALVGPLALQRDGQLCHPPEKLIALIQAFSLRAVGAAAQ